MDGAAGEQVPFQRDLVPRVARPPRPPAEVFKQAAPAGTILLGYRGSVAHGTYAPLYGPGIRDDVDLMGVMLGPLGSYFGLQNFEQIEFMYEEPLGRVWDCITYELRKYVRLLLGGNPNVLSLLWLDCDKYLLMSRAGERLIDNRRLFVGAQQVRKAFVGYAYGQLKRMSHLAPDAGAGRRALFHQFGYDTKNASHLIRLLRMGVEYLETGILTVERPDADELLAIKKGEWSLSRVEQAADDLFGRIDAATGSSPLPEEPDRIAAERILMDIFEEELL